MSDVGNVFEGIKEQDMSNDLVSVIMLSKDNGRYVEETVRSVMAQTYQNWELIFMDDSSKDDTISQMMDYINDHRIHVSRNVMYDREKVGNMRVRNLKKNNDYALWLNICEKTDCHLLDECLAKNRTKWGRLGKLLLTNKMDWRYDCF